VELEEVPREVVRLLDESVNKLCLIRDNVESLMYEIESDTINGHRSKEVFKELRQELARVDHELADSDSILQGYHEAIKEPEEDKDSVSQG
jgi:hypothetical protein